MDLQIVQGLAWVQRNATRFFAGGRPDAIALLAYIMNDVLELGTGECRIVHRDGWWLVSSDVDWLEHPNHSVHDLFENVVPAPEHGEHSLRAEVLVRAFASDICVRTRQGKVVIAGESPEERLVQDAIDLEWFARLLAFRMEG